MLGIKIDKDLNFDTHIAKLSYKTTAQLNAVSRLNRHLGKSEKTAVVNSFIYANLYYCSLVWHFCSCTSTKKIEKIQKRWLRILLDDYESYYDALFEKNGKSMMEIKWLRILAIKLFVNGNFKPKSNAK